MYRGEKQTYWSGRKWKCLFSFLLSQVERDCPGDQAVDQIQNDYGHIQNCTVHHHQYKCERKICRDKKRQDCRDLNMHALPSSRLGFPVFNSRLGQLEHEVLFIYLLNELCNFQTKMPKNSCSLPPYTNGSIVDKIIVAKLKNTFSTSMISCTATAESPGEEKGTRDVQYDQL